MIHSVQRILQLQFLLALAWPWQRDLANGEGLRYRRYW